LRILTKEKESLNNKLMDSKLEFLSMKNDNQRYGTFRDFPKNNDLMIPTVMEEDEDDVNM
jgi:hypothetical protein